jgi:hypothetical protein
LGDWIESVLGHLQQDSSNAVDVSTRELQNVHRLPILDKHRADEAAHHSSDAFLSLAGTAIDNFGFRSIEVPRGFQGTERMYDWLFDWTSPSNTRTDTAQDPFAEQGDGPQHG